MRDSYCTKWRRAARKKLVHIAGCHACTDADSLGFWLQSARIFRARVPRSLRSAAEREASGEWWGESGVVEGSWTAEDQSLVDSSPRGLVCPELHPMTGGTRHGKVEA